MKLQSFEGKSLGGKTSFRCLEKAISAISNHRKSNGAVVVERPQKTSNTNLLNETQAAEYLGLSVRTLQAWRVRGGQVAYARLGRCIRYRLEDLDDWIKSNRFTSTSQMEVRK